MCVCPLGSTVTVLNGPVLAEDKDIGPNAVVKYRLLGARVDLFTVDADTGNLTSLHRVNGEENVKAAEEVLMCLHLPPGVIFVRQGARLDREAFQEPRVELFLVGVDVGGLNNSVPLTVTILDENDNPPVFSPSSFSVRLPENSPTGEFIAWFARTNDPG